MPLPLADDSKSSSLPVATVGIIATCVLCHLKGIGGAGWGYQPRALVADPTGQWTRCLTSTLVHAPGWKHIAGNLLFLWVFGRGVEDRLGTFRFLALYAALGVAAGFAQGFAEPTTTTVIGASGAISGILGLYLVILARAKLWILNPIPFLWFTHGLTVQVPGWVSIGALAITNAAVALGLAGGSYTDIAVFAHLGGLGGGVLLGLLIRLAGLVSRITSSPPEESQ